MKNFCVSSFIPDYRWLAMLLLAGAVQWANAQSAVKISGVVTDGKTKEPVPYVHVYTKSFSGGTATDEQGKFMVEINPADTLIFSAVGFDKYFFSLKQDDIRPYYEVVIELDFKTYELEPVKVTAYKDVEQFKKEILDLNIPSRKKELTLSIPRNARVYDDPVLNNRLLDDRMNGGLAISGPIAALYNAFSKQGRQMRKLEVYRKEASERRLIASKYNIDMVKRVTSLNEEGALRFMEWCKFEDEFLLTSTEYDITVAMLKCLDDFSKNDTIN